MLTLASVRRGVLYKSLPGVYVIVFVFRSKSARGLVFVCRRTNRTKPPPPSRCLTLANTGTIVETEKYIETLLFVVYPSRARWAVYPMSGQEDTTVSRVYTQFVRSNHAVILFFDRRAPDNGLLVRFPLFGVTSEKTSGLQLSVLCCSDCCVSLACSIAVFLSSLVCRKNEQDTIPNSNIIVEVGIFAAWPLPLSPRFFEVGLAQDVTASCSL